MVIEMSLRARLRKEASGRDHANFLIEAGGPLGSSVPVQDSTVVPVGLPQHTSVVRANVLRVNVTTQ